MNKKRKISIILFLLLVCYINISTTSSSVQGSANTISGALGRVNVASPVSLSQDEAENVSLTGFEHTISFSSVETILEQAGISSDKLHRPYEHQSQISPLSEGAYEWHTFYGSPGPDEGLGIAVGSTGWIVITGISSSSWDGPDGQAPLNPYSGNDDIFVLKLDASGAYEWHTFYGSPSYEEGWGIAVDSTGGVVIVGDSFASWLGPGGQAPLHPYSGSFDIVMLKLDASGAYEWHTFYGSSNDDEGYGIAVDSTGEIVIRGSSTSSWLGPGGQASLHPYSGMSDIVLLKLDASGVYEWHTFYGSSTWDGGGGIAFDSTGGIVIVGDSFSSWLGPGGQAPLHPFIGYEPTYCDIFVLKLNSSGAYQWHTFHGSPSLDFGEGIVVDNSGRIVVVGASYSSWLGPGGQAPLNPYGGGNSGDIVVLKLDTSGTYQWHTFYGSSIDDGGWAITVDIANGILINGDSGIWLGPGGQAPLNSYSGSSDIFVLKLDTSGTYQWHTFYGSPSDDGAPGFAVNVTGEIVITGISYSSWLGPGGQAPLHPFIGYEPYYGDIVVLRLQGIERGNWIYLPLVELQ